MASKRFNLGDYNLPGLSVSAPETEQIVLIPLDLIDPDPNNFYSLDGIDELAANIETVGLLDPLRVRPVGERYTLVSGHRRRAACMLIRDGGSEQFAKGVPCIVERGETSDALRELRLIYANSATRVMSSAEISKQAERTSAVLMQLKKEGFAFKGKTRELVAQMLHTSESKIARGTAIRKNLIDGYRAAFDDGRLAESSAYRLSQESPAVQRDVFTRIGPAACSLTAADLDKLIEQVKKPKAEAQEVSPMRSSFDAEAYLAERAKEDDAFFEMLSEAANPFLRKLGTVTSRQEGIQLLKECLGRWRHGWLYDRVCVNCSPKGVLLWDANGDSDAEITRTWTDVYDMLCTIALNRAAINIGAEQEDDEDDGDDGPPRASAPTATLEDAGPQWQTGEPPEDGWYCCWATWEPESNKWDPDREFLYWRDCTWFDTPRAADNCIPAQYQVHKWYPVPDDPEEV